MVSGTLPLMPLLWRDKVLKEVKALPRSTLSRSDGRSEEERGSARPGQQMKLGPTGIRAVPAHVSAISAERVLFACALSGV